MERIFLYTSTFITVTVALAVAFLLFYPYQTYTVTELPHTSKDSYYPGEVVDFSLKACFYMPVTYELSTQLVDGSNYPYPTETIHREPGCRTIEKKSIIIPLTQTPGKYHLEFNVRTQVNIIRTEDAFYSTNDFTVLPLPMDDKQKISDTSGIPIEVAKEVVKQAKINDAKPSPQPLPLTTDTEIPKNDTVELPSPIDKKDNEVHHQLGVASEHDETEN